MNAQRWIQWCRYGGIIFHSQHVFKCMCGVHTKRIVHIWIKSYGGLFAGMAFVLLSSYNDKSSSPNGCKAFLSGTLSLYCLPRRSHPYWKRSYRQSYGFHSHKISTRLETCWKLRQTVSHHFNVNTMSLNANSPL